MDSFRDVYRWLSMSVLGGSRTPQQCRYFVENTVFSSAKRFAALSGIFASNSSESDLGVGEAGREANESDCD